MKALSRIGSLLLVLAVVGGVAAYIVARVAADRSAARVPVAAPGSGSGEAKPREKSLPPLDVYALPMGNTVAPFGRVFASESAPGEGGEVGAQPTRLPVLAFLVIHPVAGPILVDAGVTSPQRRGEALAAQLARVDLRPEDIRHVVLTDFGQDHTGELNALPNATVHVSRQAWEDREQIGYPPSFANVTNWDVFNFDSGEFHSFEASKDLFVDGSVVLLPTSGATEGHTSALLDLGAHQILLTGDAVYTLRHLGPDISSAGANTAAQRDSIRRIGELQRELPNLVLVPPHDPFEYTSKHLQPALADGALSPEERTALRAHQESLYEQGRLRPAAKPTYVPAADTESGKVAAQIP